MVMVDADPQCNLSGLVLGYKGQTEFESFYENQPQRNIRAVALLSSRARKKSRRSNASRLRGTPTYSCSPDIFAFRSRR